MLFLRVFSPKKSLTQSDQAYCYKRLWAHCRIPSNKDVITPSTTLPWTDVIILRLIVRERSWRTFDRLERRRAVSMHVKMQVRFHFVPRQVLYSLALFCCLVPWKMQCHFSQCVLLAKVFSLLGIMSDLLTRSQILHVSHLDWSWWTTARWYFHAVSGLACQRHWFDVLNDCNILRAAFMEAKTCSTDFYGRDLPAFRKVFLYQTVHTLQKGHSAAFLLATFAALIFMFATCPLSIELCSITMQTF